MEVIKGQSQKLLTEAFFDMAMAVILNIEAFLVHDKFLDFFKGFGNIVNSLLTIVFAFIVVAYVFYAMKMIVMNYKDLDKKQIFEKVETFLEGSNH